ncbi:hypothetical protein [Tenacibaculum aiptasiae]|uniref:hypothetical protein n=1 Tax=Tenacibaculum aiptasiae TaxID=426481 RepID=UPI00232D617E|nr:hypothetical protein [Tenacibaculum aiptasiae]
MKKVLFLLAMIIMVSCSSNEESLNVKEKSQEEFFSRGSNENYDDNQLGYFKSVDLNPDTGTIDNEIRITTIWVTYGEYKEIKSNPDYLFYARKTKGSTEENPILVSAKYNGAGSGHGPFEFDEDDIDFDPDNFCKWSGVRHLENLPRYYNSIKGCKWSFYNWKKHIQSLANSTCTSYRSPHPICCKGVYYGYVIAIPQTTPCIPDLDVPEPVREINEETGKWIAYKPEETHN